MIYKRIEDNFTTEEKYFIAITSPGRATPRDLTIVLQQLFEEDLPDYDDFMRFFNSFLTNGLIEIKDNYYVFTPKAIDYSNSLETQDIHEFYQQFYTDSIIDTKEMDFRFILQKDFTRICKSRQRANKPVPTKESIIVFVTLALSFVAAITFFPLAEGSSDGFWKVILNILGVIALIIISIVVVMLIRNYERYMITGIHNARGRFNKKPLSVIGVPSLTKIELEQRICEAGFIKESIEKIDECFVSSKETIKSLKLSGIIISESTDIWNHFDECIESINKKLENYQVGSFAQVVVIYFVDRLKDEDMTIARGMWSYDRVVFQNVGMPPSFLVPVFYVPNEGKLVIQETKGIMKNVMPVGKRIKKIKEVFGVK